MFTASLNSGLAVAMSSIGYSWHSVHGLTAMMSL